MNVNQERLKFSYQMLHIPYTSTTYEIKKGWRKRLKESHPDLHPHSKPFYEKLCILINDSYQQIKNAPLLEVPHVVSSGAEKRYEYEQFDKNEEAELNNLPFKKVTSKNCIRQASRNSATTDWEDYLRDIKRKREQKNPPVRDFDTDFIKKMREGSKQRSIKKERLAFFFPDIFNSYGTIPSWHYHLFTDFDEPAKMFLISLKRLHFLSMFVKWQEKKYLRESDILQKLWPINSKERFKKKLDDMLKFHASVFPLFGKFSHTNGGGFFLPCTYKSCAKTIEQIDLLNYYEILIKDNSNFSQLFVKDFENYFENYDNVELKFKNVRMGSDKSYQKYCEIVYQYKTLKKQIEKCSRELSSLQLDTSLLDNIKLCREIMVSTRCKKIFTYTGYLLNEFKTIVFRYFFSNMDNVGAELYLDYLIKRYR